MTRVILTDDHPVVRAGLRALLEASGIDVVGEAADAASAISLVEQTRPDVALMDLQLGDGPGGIETTKAIRALPNPPAVLILTTYNTDADVLRAIEAGACGYLLKDVPPTELMAAVETAARGEQVLSDAVAGRLMTLMASPASSLTSREIDVLTLVAAGSANKQIAKALFVSEATVKTHLVHINEKLHTSSRMDAVAKARELGVIR